MRNRQLPLQFKTHGGRRKGAGRKPSNPRLPRVPHLPREKHEGNHPVHTTFRVRRPFPSLRCLLAVIQPEIRKANGSAFRVTNYSVQFEHLHLMVEANDHHSLRRGMQGLMIRLAKAMNRHLGRHGKVFADRWHGRELRTPREVRNCLVYVLFNRTRHAPTLRGPDPCSSAPWFAGWDCPVRIAYELGPPTSPRPTMEPQTWLGAVGWKKGGLVGFDERPRGAC
jgi:putative transposase